MGAEDVAFLARSPNRAAVLAALVDAPCGRAELRERVGASRVTIGRITTDLEARGWVEQNTNGYRATRAGQTVVAAYERFLDVVDATHHLEPLLEHLPVEAFDFDLSALGDAEVVVPTPTIPNQHISRLGALFEQATSVSMVVHAMSPEIVASSHATARDGDHVTKGVVTPIVTDAILANETVAEQVREMVGEGTLELSERPSVPFQAGVYDETTVISADDEAGVPRGIVETQSPTVREWALGEFERLQADATPLTVEDLEPER
ncbi:helix-turn-helix transcriptional regulator [Haloarchaeobius sp. DYHT-AS-18]|uniref:helix-turn-helix transcriptional regulator n=1 Tax=Haloarchaeobius sp. DYHT-AS-18 TaxID=3446117 RepID=UPI003EC02016